MSIRISLNALRRIPYRSADEIATSIEVALLGVKVVTLSTKYNWWSRGLVTPFSGEAVVTSIGFNEDFSEHDLLEAIKAKGLEVSPHSDSRVEHFYYIRRK